MKNVTTQTGSQREQPNDLDSLENSEELTALALSDLMSQSQFESSQVNRDNQNQSEKSRNLSGQESSLPENNTQKRPAIPQGFQDAFNSL